MTEAAVLTNPLREGMRLQRTPGRCAIAIFGASGDLTKRKLIPALYSLYRKRLLPHGFAVVGCSRTPYSDDKFRATMAESVKEFSDEASYDEPSLRSFLESVHYLAGDYGQAEAYAPLRELLGRFGREQGTGGNRLFYLATPPSSFTPIVTHLGESKLAQPDQGGQAWTRIVIEKPFGYDLESARKLAATLGGVFDEKQVYRIDHYLGKETVQNLLVFRFANGMFEPVWNRRYIDHVEITVAEDLGLEGRGRYYESAGLVRDMIQNHVLSVLSLVAMEPPAAFEALDVRDEKAKLMRVIRPIDAGHLEACAVRGQYTEGWVKGERTLAYRREEGVGSQSSTETFAAFRLWIDNWRWADVPFYIRSGKRLAKRISEVIIHFRRVPHMVFGGAVRDSIEPNVISARIQPNEGISISFNAKLPAPVMEIRPVKMEFRYAESFGGEPPSAYETLLLDCMLGDQTLFNREDSVELAWQLLTPVLERWRQEGSEGLQFYPAGSWGPSAADALVERDGRRWSRL